MKLAIRQLIQDLVLEIQIRLIEGNHNIKSELTDWDYEMIEKLYGDRIMNISKNKESEKMKASYLEELKNLLEGLHMQNIDLLIETMKSLDYFLLGSFYYHNAVDKEKETCE